MKFNIKKISFKQTISIWILFSVIGLCLFAAITYWNGFTTPFERDEGEYAYSAWLLDQGIMPYENTFLLKPPMIVYTYWLAQEIDQDAVWPARVIAFIFTLLTIIVLGIIVKNEWGNNMALLTAWISIPMLSLPHLYSLAANTERFMLLPLVSMLAIYTYNKHTAKAWPWLISGSLSSIALLYKPIALFALFFIFIIWLYQNWDYHKNIEKLLHNILLIITGGLSTSFIILAPFIISGDWIFMWESVVQYSAQYAQHTKEYIPDAVINQFKIFWSTWPTLFVLFIWYLIRRPKQWWFYLSLMLISFFTIFSSPLGHYYLLLMPFWILITVSSINSLLDFINLKVCSKDWRRVILLLPSAVIIVSMIVPIQRQYFLSPKDLNVWIYGYGSPFIESVTISEKIKEMTDSADNIFVAGSEPQIYYYSKRRSSGRFIITYPLNINTPLRERYQRLAIKDLGDNPPKIIVVSRRQTSSLWEEGSPYIFYNYINEIINNNYTLIGGYVWNKNISHWQEPITGQDQINSSSLLLFKKI